MTGVLALEKHKFTDCLLRHDSSYVNISLTKHYIIRSDYSPIKSIFVEFDISSSVDMMLTHLRKQINDYLQTIPFKHIAATVWNDCFSCVISIYPLIGAA